MRGLFFVCDPAEHCLREGHRLTGLPKWIVSHYGADSV
jgi:hypothetical protein